MTALLLAAPLLVRAGPAIQVPLQLEGEGPWYRLDLPIGLQMAAHHTDLRDLRITNAEGEELAYSLTLDSAQSKEQRREAAVKWFPLHGAADAQAAPAIRVQRGAGGTLVEVASEQLEPGEQIRRGWLLDASGFDQPLHSLSLDWRSDEEGFQRFSIEASDDLQHWRRWGDGQIARLSFAGERVEQREVALPGIKARYLRLLWQTPQAAPLLLDARLVSITSQAQAPALTWSEPLRPAAAEPGEYRWDFPLALPLRRVRVSLPAGDVLAPVSLFSRSADEPERDRRSPLAWQPLATDLLYRLPQDGKEALRNEIELDGAPVRQLRMRVDTRGGGFGGAAPEIQVAVRGTQVVFLVRGSAPYSLTLGDASARSAALPLGTLIPGYEPKRLAGLGRAIAPDQVPVAARQTVDTAQAGTNWKRIGLWAVLLIGVALLGGMAFSLLRKPAAD